MQGVQQTLFKFDPNASDAPLPRGRYDASIANAEVKTSRAGNEMLELTLRMQSPDGSPAFLRDYLVSTPRMKWKIKRFCQALGLDFAKGQIDPTGLQNLALVVEVGVEEDMRGRDRNVISDYVPTFDFRPENQPHDHARPGENASPRDEQRKTQPAPAGPQRRVTSEEEEEIPF